MLRLKNEKLRQPLKNCRASDLCYFLAMGASELFHDKQ